MNTVDPTHLLAPATQDRKTSDAEDATKEQLARLMRLAQELRQLSGRTDQEAGESFKRAMFLKQRKFRF